MASQDKQPTPIKLPILRYGITTTFGDYDRTGKPYWLIHDAGRNKFFIIGWVEYQLLEHWKLGSSDTVLDAINNKTTLHLDLSDIENFIRFLKQNYLIDQSGYEIQQLAKDQKIFKKDSWWHWLVSHYLFFRIPLWHPDKFLTRTTRIASFLFHRYLGYVMLALGFIALFQISMRWSDFTHSFSSIFSLQGLFFYFIAFSVCKFCHELGHAYMCKHYGIPIPSLGVAFLVFWPVLYTDTTLSWRLNSNQRMHIALAGIWVETYVTILAALIWCNVHNVTLQAICYVVITVNWMGSLLINVSPFMRFDGYYVLADALKMPNLQPRAFALTRWQIRRWLFDWPEPAPETFSKYMHLFLVTYSLITWAYRLVLYLGIAVLVYHFVIKIVGIILFAIEIFYFVLGPLLTEFKTWFAMRKQLSWNNHTIISLTIFMTGILFFFLPLQESIRLPGTLSYAHQFLIAPENGVIGSKIPTVGSIVKANQPIIIINSPDLDNALRLTQLEYNRKLSELRNSKINSKYFNQKNIIISEINKAQAEYKKLYSLRDRLTLKVPFDGIIYEVAPDLKPGNVVMKDEWVADVIQPSIIKIEGYVYDQDLLLIKNGLSGYFYPHSLSDKRIPVKVISIDSLNTSQLNCQYSSAIKQDKKLSSVVDTPCYNSSDLGGDIATYLADDGTFIPVESMYRVLLQPLGSVALNHIQRGTIILNTQSRSYASRSFYWIKRIFIQQSGF